MTRTTEQWEALLSECADSWELGDTYADGSRLLLEEGSVIGTINMHITHLHEEVVVAAPASVAEVVRLRQAMTRLRDTYAAPDDPGDDYGRGMEAAYQIAADDLTRILEGEEA